MKHIKAFEKRINGVKTRTWLCDGVIINQKQKKWVDARTAVEPFVTR